MGAQASSLSGTYSKQSVDVEEHDLNKTNIETTLASQNVKSSQNEDKQLIPCVFTWTHGGQEVFITGSFNDWSIENKIKLVRSTNEFSVVHELPRGIHQFKFIVDDNWKYAPEQATQCDANGNINNIINISNYQYHAFRVPSEHEQARYAIYSQRIPDHSEFVEAPTLPYLLFKASPALQQDLNPTLQLVPPPNAPPRPPNLYVPFQCSTAHVFQDSLSQYVLGPHATVVEHLSVTSPPLPSYIPPKLTNTIFVSVNPLRPLPVEVVRKARERANPANSSPPNLTGNDLSNPMNRLLKKHKRKTEGGSSFETPSHSVSLPTSMLQA
eukprot:GDKJ01002513.1.p1 GENE.GDKJ01002513.1~~GDKJ01002513.1.p1  ORF type:complete len:326 (-),score=49.40 GDKJ01002513.1:117-1094(-)